MPSPFEGIAELESVIQEIKDAEADLKQASADVKDFSELSNHQSVRFVGGNSTVMLDYLTNLRSIGRRADQFGARDTTPEITPEKLLEVFNSVVSIYDKSHTGFASVQIFELREDQKILAVALSEILPAVPEVLISEVEDIAFGTWARDILLDSSTGDKEILLDNAALAIRIPVLRQEITNLIGA